MRRAMQVIEGQGPQESNNTYFCPYDHPYFGQLFLGGVLKLIGYPDILSPKAGDVHSIEMLYLVPRIIMGLLAVVDTFLIYKIGQLKYNKNIGLLSAAIFAVVPITWMLRRVCLNQSNYHLYYFQYYLRYILVNNLRKILLANTLIKKN